jgi:ribosomal protein L12E/L44/L45/RPP1/RPP2
LSLRREKSERCKFNVSGCGKTQNKEKEEKEEEEQEEEEEEVEGVFMVRLSL